MFSLAATVYSLLAGQTPFERRGQRNTASDLIHRITSEPLPPLNRPDVPPELNRVLSIAMAKDPAGRYDTALAFGRGLQQVELSLSLPVTQMDVLDDRVAPTAHSAEDDELDMHTRIRKVATVDPDAGATTGPGTRRRLDPYAGVAPAVGAPAAPGPTSPTPAGFASPAAAASDALVESTVLRPAGAPLTSASAPSPLPAPGSAAAGTAPSKTPVWPFVTLAAILVIVLGVGATLAVRHFVVPEPAPIATSEINLVTDAKQAPGPPTDLTLQVIAAEEGGGRTGRVQVSWEPPADATDEDYFIVTWKDLPGNYERYAAQHEVHGRNSHVLEIPPKLPERCVEVKTVTPDGLASASEEKCL
ncbi:hypothetical protein [Brachybacterium sp. UNK5269]|uniref:hypothetical protein n=1 Tax=Brachybacterium sp. UNK5269 TaxID=3408576 RepID=UPI003BAF2E35